MKSRPTDPISNHKATRNKYIFYFCFTDLSRTETESSKKKKFVAYIYICRHDDIMLNRSGEIPPISSQNVTHCQWK